MKWSPVSDYSFGMKVASRISLVLGAAAILFAFFWVAWAVLPSVRQCDSINCGDNFDPGGLNLFGAELFTPAQTIIMIAGILVAAFMIALAIFPRGFVGTAVGLSV